LAALHRHTAEQHGLDQDNFIGRLPQPNTPGDSWAAFYGQHRIGFQMELARQRGRLPKRREDLLTRLIARLPDLLDDTAIQPSLLHGDLWGGTYLIDDRGQAVLIDPAVCYGHREMDLAMSELFGGFSGRFYDAYAAAYPPDGYPERRALYQLYYILAHLNLFGESYGGRVDSLAAHYVGWGK
jgi:fructosamine-3-kinase